MTNSNIRKSLPREFDLSKLNQSTVDRTLELVNEETSKKLRTKRQTTRAASKMERPLELSFTIDGSRLDGVV